MITGVVRSKRSRCRRGPPGCGDELKKGAIENWSSSTLPLFRTRRHIPIELPRVIIHTHNT